ncbi:Cold acclimation WCOR413 [Macleaya cordata]|uniref:Cold acclimation WCOR413 n=1 Tax=Macleaya cordata TaxID=56857 RepID=A0A200Q3Z5_MACCD|nr:Cold acclimation WCOR413 [Macleaya cordata]
MLLGGRGRNTHAESIINALYFLESSFSFVQLSKVIDHSYTDQLLFITALQFLALRVVGRWLAFISVLLQLSFPGPHPAQAFQSASMNLLVVVAPDFVAETVRDGWAGSVICLVIGCIFLAGHILGSGGFRNAFTTTAGILTSIGLSLLIVYPILALILHSTT